MTENKRWPWWRIVLVVLAIPVGALFLIFTVFERGSSSSDTWNTQVDDAFAFYVTEYITPVNSHLEADLSCYGDSTGDVVEACDAFVKTLREREDELIEAADQFESLATTTPEGASREWELSLYELSRILRSMQEADGLLVTAWSERDELQWGLGWQYKERAGERSRSYTRRLFGQGY